MNKQIDYKQMEHSLDLCKEGGSPSVAFFPVGCTEQHGPYLPIQTDSIIAAEMAHSVCDMLPDDHYGFVFPELSYSSTKSNLNYQGTISIEENTFRSIVRDIAKSISRSGFRVAVFLCGHGPAHASLVEVCFNQMHDQYSVSPRPATLFLAYSLSNMRFLLEDLAGQPAGKHADWCEFLLLYHCLGEEYFTEQKVEQLHQFQRDHDFSMPRSSILGMPVSMKSVQGTIGEPLPFNGKDIAALANDSWQATAQHLCSQIVSDIEDSGLMF